MATRLPQKTFNVVVLYSNEDASAQIMQTYQRIQNALNHLKPFEIHLWLLDLLDEPDLLAAASEDLTSAAMVVVNTSDAHIGSEAFRLWAESWPAASQDEPRALVAFHPLCEPPRTHAPAPDATWLRGLAARKGMDFLSNESSAPDSIHPIPIAWKGTLETPQSVTVSAAPLRTCWLTRPLNFNVFASTNETDAMLTTHGPGRSR